MASKQSEWQYRHEQMGLCRSCSKPATDGVYCDKHGEANRTRDRNRYRMAHGIPLDAPPMRTRPRG